MPEQVKDKPEKSLRVQRREARMKFVRDAREPRKVRVSPAKEEYRGLIKHPNGGGFRSSGSIEWPFDTFTKRRIRDGDVIVEAREQNKPEAQTTAKSTAKPTARSAPSSGETP